LRSNSRRKFYNPWIKSEVSLPQTRPNWDISSGFYWVLLVFYLSTYRFIEKCSLHTLFEDNKHEITNVDGVIIMIMMMMMVVVVVVVVMMMMMMVHDVMVY